MGSRRDTVRISTSITRSTWSRFISRMPRVRKGRMEALCRILFSWRARWIRGASNRLWEQAREKQPREPRRRGTWPRWLMTRSITWLGRKSHPWIETVRITSKEAKIRAIRKVALASSSWFLRILLVIPRLQCHRYRTPWRRHRLIWMTEHWGKSKKLGSSCCRGRTSWLSWEKIYLERRRPDSATLFATLFGDSGLLMMSAISILKWKTS